MDCMSVLNNFFGLLLCMWHYVNVLCTALLLKRTFKREKAPNPLVHCPKCLQQPRLGQSWLQGPGIQSQVSQVSARNWTAWNITTATQSLQSQKTKTRNCVVELGYPTSHHNRVNAKYKYICIYTHICIHKYIYMLQKWSEARTMTKRTVNLHITETEQNSLDGGKKNTRT